MSDRRVAARPLNEAALVTANAAVFPDTGRRPIRAGEDELQQKWMDAYVASGGRLVGEPRGRKPDDVCEECDDKKLVITLIELEYLSDHNVLKDNLSDWKNTGAPYPTPDWTVGGTSNPITHDMKERIRLRLRFDVGEPGAARESGRVRGLQDGAVMFQSSSMTFRPVGRQAVVFDSKTRLEELVSEKAWSFEWQVQSSKTYPDWTAVGTTTTNPAYTIFNGPIEGSLREDGATDMRMETAVEWVGHEKTTTHSEILNYMFSKFNRYVLGIANLEPAEQRRIEGDADLKRRMGEVEWPTYFVDDFGAWPIVELQEWGAECQAICRMVRGMLRQVGSDRDVRLVYISADFSDPSTPKEQTEPTGPDASKEYALADAPVEVGRTYWEPRRGEQAEVGWNNFEAYLKYTWRGYARWYGGGVGLIEQGTNPLHVFHALVEYEWVSRTVTVGSSRRTQSGRKIIRAHFYR